MKSSKRLAALLLGASISFSAVLAMAPETAYAAAWEKMANGTYQASDGSSITGVVERGIDVSHWKQTIDWNRVAADDVKFVMLGTRYNNDVDPYFATNAIGAHKAGIKVGAYLYSYATTTEMAEAEADFVLNLIKDYPISYPVVIDVESAEMSSLEPTKLSEIINAFCKKIENAGYYPMVYSNDYWLSNKIDMTKLHYDVWAARYDVKPTYTGAAIWQATNQGEINGISGAVDINFALKDLSSKIASDRWRLIGGQWYYYDDYVKQTGWINDGNSYYYLKEDGTQHKGWLQQNNEFYYLLPETGQLQTGWKKIEDKWYYFKPDGRMANEWLTLDDKYYYLYNGAMVTGWLRIGDDYYFMRSDGSMATGWRLMDDQYYYFNTNGKLVRGWANLDGKYYYLKADGTMVTGWQTIDNKTYYFNPDGDVAMKWTKIEDDWYYFAEDGTMMTGWIQLDGRYYYLHTDGRMVTGWQSDGTNTYYLDVKSGKMAMGWKEIDDTWYYFTESGHMVSGWLLIDGKYYYLNPADGKMVSDGSYTINDVNYTFDQDGVCQNEASAIDGGSAGSVYNSPITSAGTNVTAVNTTPADSAAPGSTGTGLAIDNSTGSGVNNAGGITVITPGMNSGVPGSTSESGITTEVTSGGGSTGPGSNISDSGIALAPNSGNVPGAGTTSVGSTVGPGYNFSGNTEQNTQTPDSSGSSSSKISGTSGSGLKPYQTSGPG